MNERKQLWIILEAVAVCVCFSAIYAIGGSGDFFGGQKWLRRFVAPAIFCVWAFLRSGFDWRYFIQMPFMFGALCLPYGADELIGKIILRGSFGLANGSASSLANTINGRWLLVGIQIFIVTLFSIVFGVWNPLLSMPEQFVIGFIIIFIPAMSVRRKL